MKICFSFCAPLVSACAVALLCTTSPPAAQAQSVLQLKRIINNWPTIEVYFTSICGGRFTTFGDTASIEIYEDGTRMSPITLWCPDTNETRIPASVALVFDGSGTMNGDPILQEMQAGEDFVSMMDGVLDEACVLRFEGYVALFQTMTISKTLLTNTISRLPAQGYKAVWDGCYEGILEVTSVGTNPSRAVLLFTDGEDDASTHTLQEVIALANKYRIRVFTLGFGGVGGADSLEYLAQYTGGRHLSHPTLADIATIMSDIKTPMHDHTLECLVTYDAQCMNGATRTVEIVAKGICGDTLRTSRTYTAPRDGFITLGSDSVIGGTPLTVPLNYTTSIAGTITLPVANFSLEIADTGCGLRFARIDTPPGTILNGVPLTTTVAGGVITIRTTAATRYKVGAHLADAIFDTEVRSDTCCTDILLSTSLPMTGCVTTSTAVGAVCVLPTTTAVEPLPTASAIDVFPDPNNGACFVTMSLDAPGAVELTVVDLFGRTRETRRSTGNTGSNTFTVDMRALPAGAYFLVCHTSTRTITRIVRHF